MVQVRAQSGVQSSLQQVEHIEIISATRVHTTTELLLHLEQHKTEEEVVVEEVVVVVVAVL